MADELNCCICGQPAAAGNVVGQRAYCDRHFAQVNKPHTGFWRAGLVQIAGMGVFASAVALIAGALPPLDRTLLIAFGLVMAVVPTALWMIFFYRQDRLEPEPKHKLGLVFMTALLLTELVGRRAVYEWFRIDEWATTPLLSLAANTLIAAAVWQAIVYVGVRMVYATDEFDERMDGIVYGTVAGLGVATMLNLHYIVDNEGVALAPGVIQVVTTALAQAAFGGLQGWFMAEAKFVHKPAWFVPLGMALSIVANGVFDWLIGEVSTRGLDVNPWWSLAMGVVVAVALFFVLVGLMRRSTAITLRRKAG